MPATDPLNVLSLMVTSVLLSDASRILKLPPLPKVLLLLRNVSDSCRIVTLVVAANDMSTAPP